MVIINTTFSGITLYSNIVPLLHVEHGNARSRKMVGDCGFCVYSKAFFNQAFNSRLVFFRSSFEGTEGTEAVAEILNAAEGAACFTH